MEERRAMMDGGCRERLILTMALLWFGLIPLVSPTLVDAILGDWIAGSVLDGVIVLFATLALVVPFAGLTLLARSASGAESLAAAAGSLAIASGYVILDAVLRLVLPAREIQMPLRGRYAIAGLRLSVMLPYAALAAQLARRATGQPRRAIREWLGLGRPQWSTWLLALAAAALVTVPWPLTGALGDSLTSLALGVQALSTVVPQLLIFWGVIFVLLTSSTARTEMGAMTAILIYALSALGEALPQGDAGAVNSSLFLLPMALLLTEIRARDRCVWPLLPLALFYRLLPALFVDPRDALAQGIPELQHIVSHWVVGAAATILALTLWLRRRASERRRTIAVPEGRPPGATLLSSALLALVAWGTWFGLYASMGEPGFFNDGFLIVLEEQVDLEAAAGIADRQSRRNTVRRALIETAEASQEPIRRELEALGVPYRPYYVINMVRVDGHRWLMGRFEGRPGVDRVILNPNVRRYPRRILLPAGRGAASGTDQGNLSAIHADVAWTMGVRGQGVVVGAQDSGFAWDHPALKAQYRGWDGANVDHNNNWHDAWDDTLEPFDDGSHGTRTLGTVLGDDGGDNRIGVAPEATWIGCRNMRRGFGNPGSYAECMEFLLAPYPLGGDAFRDGDVRLAADVINNSWGCPRWEGCFPETLRPAVEALRAAGSMMVVSAGNDGPACGTATTSPANYDASFTVGATTDEGDVVGFSSRGPADSLIKPDIAAPGQAVRSSVPGGGYGAAGGTSMAAPHVAGTVALGRRADRRLIGDIEATEELLCRTATSKPVRRPCAAPTVDEGPSVAGSTPQVCACGGVNGVPNNVYGCGVVDAGAAVEAALAE